MKLIGIAGKVGSGKTTLSNIIAKKENVGVIHVDELMNKIEKENLSKIMDDKEQGESSVKKDVRKLIYKNKYIFLMFIRLKRILLKGKIDKKIEEFEKEGKEIVVIEYIHLKYLHVFKKLDKRVLVQRPYIERQESVLMRDSYRNIDKETFALWDIPYKRSYYKEDVGSYEYKVDNESIEKLEQAAEEIYKEVSATHKKNQNRRKNNLEQYKCKDKCKASTLEIGNTQLEIKRKEEEKTHEDR